MCSSSRVRPSALKLGSANPDRRTLKYSSSIRADDAFVIRCRSSAIASITSGSMIEAQPRAEDRGAEHADGILDEADSRIADRSNDALFQITKAADVVDDRLRRRVVEERVDREVAAERVLFGRAECIVAMDEVLVPRRARGRRGRPGGSRRRPPSVTLRHRIGPGHVMIRGHPDRPLFNQRRCGLCHNDRFRRLPPPASGRRRCGRARSRPRRSCGTSRPRWSWCRT